MIPRTDGTFVSQPGVIDAKGAFRIPGVPSGVFYLKWQWSFSGSWPVFIASDRRSFDVGGLYLGRPDAEVAGQVTPLAVRASRMSPWQRGDSLQLFSLGALCREDNLDQLADLPPEEGTTELDLAVDVSLFANPCLVDGSRSDRAIISQQVARQSEAVWYWANSRSFVAPSFSQVDGEPALIEGEFQELPEQKTSLTWDQPSFAERAAEVNPAALALGQYLLFEADPAGPGRTSLWDAPHFLVAYSEAPTDDSAVLHMNLTSGNPFPAKWPRLVEVATEFHVPSLPESFGGVSISSVLPLDEATKGPLVPVITPARRLRVAGQAANRALSATGLTPTVEWEAPARGKPSMYILDVYQQDGAGDLRLAGVVLTDLTRVTIPPDVLEPDAPYLLMLTAATGRQVNRPNQATGPRFGYADSVSAMLVP
jgi:hypothetical protein